MRHRTLARWLVVGALAGWGLVALGSLAQAQDEPAPTMTQEGDNSGTISQGGEARSADAAAGSQVVGIVGEGDASVSASNSSEDAEARSGDVRVSNSVNSMNVGPRASGNGLPSDTTVISQVGDNEAEVSQNAVAVSGDAVAGSQIVGVVTTDDAFVDVVLANESEDAESESGFAESTNDVGQVASGPSILADVTDIPDEPDGGNAQGAGGSPAPVVPIGAVAVVPAQVGAAQVGEGASVDHVGDNSLEADQNADSLSGDAVAGGQVVGLVAFEQGSISVNNRQSSDEPTATTGSATVGNTLGTATAGPRLFLFAGESENEVPGQQGPGGPTEADPFRGLGGAGGAADANAGDAVVTGTIGQTGDNELEASQSGSALSGDAVAGSQVTGAVSAGVVVVTKDNTSEDDEATSGDASVTNAAQLLLSGARGAASAESSAGAFGGAGGPGGSGFAPMPGGAGGAGGDATADAGDATASVRGDQTGDNALDFSQSGTAATGDAVAGGQVTGVVVSEGGSAVLDATNDSEDSTASSGAATVANTTGLIEVGPGVETTANASAGALGGAGGPGGLPAVVPLGPGAPGGAGGAAVANAADAVAEAVVSQTGDNEVDFGQTGAATSGDAVAGGQVTGIVGSGDAVVTLANTSEDADAQSGAATAENSAGAGGGRIDAGPLANAQAVAGAQAFGGAGGAGSIVFDPQTGFQMAVPGEAGGAATVNADAVTVTGETTIAGDTEIDASQNAIAGSGDAVAGGQVTGVVTTEGGDVAIDATNDSDGDESVSGDAAARNALAMAGGVVAAGPVAVVNASGAASARGENAAGREAGDPATVTLGPFVADATLTQEGDAELDADQNASALTGDAVAGGQVTGVVSGGVVTIVLDSTSEDGEAASGNATAENAAATEGGRLVSGPFAGVRSSLAVSTVINGGGAATISQSVTGPLSGQVSTGDSELDLSQGGSAITGDAVASGQVVGVVASEGSVVAIDATNDAEDATAESGESLATNDAAVGAGSAITSGGSLDVALAGQASLLVNGGGNATIDQTLNVGGPHLVNHDGDSELELGQDALAVTGDAVGGGQVFGVVTTEGGVVGIVASNTAEDAESRSGSATSANEAATRGGTIAAGPSVDAFAVVDANVVVNGGGGADITQTVTVAPLATLSHTGDDELELGQEASATTGDAVAGGQVTGVVAGGSVLIDAENSSDGDEADSGAATSTNALATDNGSVTAGPSASALARVGVDLTVNGGGQATITQIASATGVGAIEQVGDNELEWAQDAAGSTGDAVAGGQVFGVVSEDGSSTAIVARNTSEDSEAASGEANASNDAAANDGQMVAGPSAFAFASLELSLVVNGGESVTQTATAGFDAGIEQVGDNELEGGQDANATTGDAIAGGQVVGLVASDGAVVAIAATNDSEDASSAGGNATATNSAASGDGLIAVGPATFGVLTVSSVEVVDGDVEVTVVSSGTGGILQTGDNDFSLDQAGIAGTGDAVSGGQVIGGVVGGTVVVVLDNTSEDDSTVAGDATDVNTVDIVRIGAFFPFV